MTEKNNNSLIYLFAALFGALLGIGSVYILEKTDALEGEDNLLNKKNISKVGLGAVSFLYSILGKNKRGGRGNLLG